MALVWVLSWWCGMYGWISFDLFNKIYDNALSYKEQRNPHSQTIKKDLNICQNHNLLLSRCFLFFVRLSHLPSHSPPSSIGHWILPASFCVHNLLISSFSLCSVCITTHCPRKKLIFLCADTHLWQLYIIPSSKLWLMSQLFMMRERYSSTMCTTAFLCSVVVFLLSPLLS